MRDLTTYDQFLNESKNPWRFKVYIKEGEITEIEVLNSEIFEDDEEEDSVPNIEIELEDETGKTLDSDPEEESVQEKAKPPNLTKKERQANTVKANVTRRTLGPDSPLRGQINKIFMLVKKEIKKEASKLGVPVKQINMDNLTIKA